MSKANFAIVVVVLSISGCGGGRLIDLAVDLKPGMQPTEVEKLLGKPSGSYMDEVYMRHIRRDRYDEWEMKLAFHDRRGLAEVVVCRWPRACAGIALRDRFDDIKDRLLEQPPAGVDNYAGYLHFRTEGWPEAKCVVSRVGTDRKVVEIALFSGEVFGHWEPIGK